MTLRFVEGMVGAVEEEGMEVGEDLARVRSYTANPHTQDFPLPTGSGVCLPSEWRTWKGGKYTNMYFFHRLFNPSFFIGRPAEQSAPKKPSLFHFYDSKLSLMSLLVP